MKPETMSQDEHLARKARSYKLILGFAMVSMTMMFAGLTSAFVISKSRADWLRNFELPSAFYMSTVVIIGCSITFWMAKRAIKVDDRSAVTRWLLSTLALGLVFVYLQFYGFSQVVAAGHFFTGIESSVTSTYMYVFAMAHLAHLFGGLLALLVIIYNHFKQKYNSRQSLGIELGAMYWHFLDFLWVYLFLFLYFFK
jgi:cytochrome c oxidase subunit III